MAGRIKGVAIREFLAYLREELGDEAVIAAMRTFSAEDQTLIDLSHPHLGFLGGSWYEARLVGGFMDALIETGGLTKRTQDRLAEGGTRRTLSRNLNGIHRAILRIVGTPERHARFAQRLWDTYFGEGTIESTSVGDRKQQIRYFGWDGHHPWLCGTLSTASVVLYEHMGLQGVQVRRLGCISTGNRDCSHELTWL